MDSQHNIHNVGYKPKVLYEETGQCDSALKKKKRPRTLRLLSFNNKIQVISGWVFTFFYLCYIFVNFHTKIYKNNQVGEDQTFLSLPSSHLNFCTTQSFSFLTNSTLKVLLAVILLNLQHFICFLAYGHHLENIFLLTLKK